MPPFGFLKNNCYLQMLFYLCYPKKTPNQNEFLVTLGTVKNPKCLSHQEHLNGFGQSLVLAPNFIASYLLIQRDSLLFKTNSFPLTLSIPVTLKQASGFLPWPVEKCPPAGLLTCFLVIVPLCSLILVLNCLLVLPKYKNFLHFLVFLEQVSL